MKVHGQVVPIAELHCNDAQGIPAAPHEVGTLVQIAGVITAGTGTFSNIRTELYVQDDTGGMLLYRSDFMWQATLGDSVLVTGEIAQYKGTTEVIPSGLEIIASGLTQPDPEIVTCSMITHAFGTDYCEPDESKLVRVLFATYDEDAETITDASGSCFLHIDFDTGIELSSGTYHIIGIVKQWDPSLPYTGDYELLPRFQGDIEGTGGPQFITEPVEGNITPTGFAVSWHTDVPSSSMLLWGIDQAGDLGVIEDSTQTTAHCVTITGLEPATIYRLQAASSNVTGESRSPVWFASTASAQDCSGKITIYFNQSVETEYATHQPAHGEMSLQRRLLDRINGASFSIDACFYYLTVPEITTALISAKNRGIQVRVVYEADSEGQEIDRLRNAGIPVLADDSGDNDGSGLMHNKFLIFDYKDRSSAADDYVWSGSANVTHYGFYENAENVILFQDQALAGAYSAEFEEMWGSSDALPSEDDARFGRRKTDNTPHRFQIGEASVELYMSPSDGVASRFMDFISTAERGLYFAIFNFTNDDLSSSMKEARNAHGLRVAGVFDDGQVGSSSEYWPMSGQGSGAWSPPADVHLLGAFPSMHHKYLLIDADNTGDDGAVATGSYNWTRSAETQHDENMLFIHDARVANLYLQEFMARYHQAGGSDTLALSVTKESSPEYLVLSVGPNPWIHGTRLRVQAPTLTTVALYDMAGRRALIRQLDPGSDTVELEWGLIGSGSHVLVAYGQWGRMMRRIVCYR